MSEPSQSRVGADVCVFDFDEESPGSAQPRTSAVRTSPARTSPAQPARPRTSVSRPAQKDWANPARNQPSWLAAQASSVCQTNFLNLLNHCAPEFDAAGGEIVEKVCKLSVGHRVGEEGSRCRVEGSRVRSDHACCHFQAFCWCSFWCFCLCSLLQGRGSSKGLGFRGFGVRGLGLRV